MKQRNKSAQLANARRVSALAKHVDFFVPPIIAHALTGLRHVRSFLTVLWELLRDGLQFMNVAARSRSAVAAEVLFLRKQLAYYHDHNIQPRRLTDAARLSLVLWSRFFDWREPSDSRCCLASS